MEGAPPTTRGIQCKLTKEREELRLEVLKHDAKEADRDHKARTDKTRYATHAFARVLGEAGRLARVWLTCWGDADNKCSPLEMRMMAQWYLALPDPRVQALGLQQAGRKNGRNVDITAPLYVNYTSAQRCPSLQLPSRSIVSPRSKRHPGPT